MRLHFIMTGLLPTQRITQNELTLGLAQNSSYVKPKRVVSDDVGKQGLSSLATT